MICAVCRSDKAAVKRSPIERGFSSRRNNSILRTHTELDFRPFEDVLLYSRRLTIASETKNFQL